MPLPSQGCAATASPPPTEWMRSIDWAGVNLSRGSPAACRRRGTCRTPRACSGRSQPRGAPGQRGGRPIDASPAISRTRSQVIISPRPFSTSTIRRARPIRLPEVRQGPLELVVLVAEEEAEHVEVATSAVGAQLDAGDRFDSQATPFGRGRGPRRWCRGRWLPCVARPARGRAAPASGRQPPVGCEGVEVGRSILPSV